MESHIDVIAIIYTYNNEVSDDISNYNNYYGFIVYNYMVSDNILSDVDIACEYIVIEGKQLRMNTAMTTTITTSTITQTDNDYRNTSSKQTNINI